MCFLDIDVDDYYILCYFWFWTIIQGVGRKALGKT